MNPKYEHYRLEAAHCEAEAESAVSEDSRADWLRLAARWLAMIPHSSKPSAHATFESALENRGTGQEQSRSSH